ncbi:MAG: DinB family protein [Sphingobacteriales bacterium]|nr:MAG: DinB family protein [Sphingobacteriales bacterium]
MPTLFQQIDSNTKLVQDLFGQLTLEQLNETSGAQWSIAQNIAHLILINSSYFPIIDQLQQKVYKRPFHGRFQFIVKFLGGFVKQSVEPSRQKKMKTFPVWEPKETIQINDIIEQFKAHHEDLKRYVELAMPFIQNKTVIHSPASKVIVYELDTVFEIIIQHELRHIEQAKEQLQRILK